MHPSELWWLYEAKMPEQSEDKWADLYDLLG